MKNFITVSEAAKMIGLTPRRVQQLIAKGQIKVEYIHPKMHMVYLDEFKKYLKTRGVK